MNAFEVGRASARPSSGIGDQDGGLKPAVLGEEITRREAIRRTAWMLGVAVSPSLVNGVLCAQTAARGSAPAYLTAAQFATVDAIAERILPKTDTPGARDVGVPAFIDLMYGKYLTEEERQLFSAGIAEVESASAAAHRRGFSQLAPAQQDSVLTAIAVAAQSKEKTFFHLAKEIVLLGYFTSETVGKQVLKYDPIPGRFDGCIPLSESGNVSWTR
jgi:gluconate 2-dehydrogenase gamma chain